jgi:hypothetical protein
MYDGGEKDEDAERCSSKGFELGATKDYYDVVRRIAASLGCSTEFFFRRLFHSQALIDHVGLNSLQTNRNPHGCVSRGELTW